MRKSKKEFVLFNELAKRAGLALLFVMCFTACPQKPADNAKPQTEWMMPYLRWFDSADELIAFETARGNTLSAKDETMQIYTFQTKSSKMPTIIYAIGQSIQIALAPELAKSEELKVFLARNGFSYMSEDWSPKFMLLSTTKYKTVNGFIYADYPGVGTFLGFSLKEPTFTTLPLPLLDWNSSEDAIKTFEGKTGRKLLEKKKDNKGRDQLIYGSQKQGEEYEEIFISRYIIQNGTLVKVQFQVTPAHYILKPMGEVFNAMPEFETYVKKLGYIISKIENGKLNVYTHSANGNKFTMNMWNIKMKDGRLRVFANLDFVPADGPNIVE